MTPSPEGPKANLPQGIQWWHPWGYNSIPGDADGFPEGLIASLGGTDGTPGGLSIPEGPMPSLADQWHFDCPSEASLPHASLPQAAQDPRILPGWGTGGAGRALGLCTESLQNTSLEQS